MRALLYIQLMPFPTHYLVLVVTDTDIRYALISVKIVPDSMYQSLVMEDIGWLDVERICGRGREARTQNAVREPVFGGPGAESSKLVPTIDHNAMLVDEFNQIQTGDHGSARALYLLLVHVHLLPVLWKRLIVLVKCPRSTHEGRESTQKAQHPVLARIPTIPHCRWGICQRHRRGSSFCVWPPTQHALTCNPSVAYPVFRRFA